MTDLEKAARAAYQDWIKNVQSLEPSWEELPQSHRDRMIESFAAGLRAIERPSEEMFRYAFVNGGHLRILEEVWSLAIRGIVSGEWADRRL